MKYFTGDTHVRWFQPLLFKIFSELLTLKYKRCAGSKTMNLFKILIKGQIH